MPTENGRGTAGFDSLSPHQLVTSHSNVSLDGISPSPMSRGSDLQTILDNTIKPFITQRVNKHEFKNAQDFCQKLKKRQ